MIVPELKFRNAPMKLRLRAALMDALHAALAVATLDGVLVDMVADVPSGAVYRQAVGEVIAELAVLAASSVMIAVSVAVLARRIGTNLRRSTSAKAAASSWQ